MGSMAGKGNIPRRVKPEGGLKRVADAKKSGSKLLEDIERHLIGEAEAGFDPTNRRFDVIHPSEIASSDWCPYSTYLRIKLAREGKLPPRAPNRFNLQNIFDTGHEYHNKWQDRAQRMGRLFGTYVCLVCGHRWKSVSPPECVSCGLNVLRYGEVGLHDERANIHGHADGHITDVPMVTSLDDVLWEVKSIGLGTVRRDNTKLIRDNTYEVLTHTGMKRKVIDHEAIFSSIKMPFPSHLRQGLIYLRLYNTLERITFLYEYKATSQVKTFTVKRNDDAVQWIWDTCYDIMYALDKGGTPPECPKNGCAECKPLRELEPESEDNDQDPAQAPSTTPPALPARVRRSGRPRPRTDGATSGEAGVDERRHLRPRRPHSDEPDVLDDSVGRLRGWSARRG